LPPQTLKHGCGPGARYLVRKGYTMQKFAHRRYWRANEEGCDIWTTHVISGLCRSHVGKLIIVRKPMMSEQFTVFGCSESRSEQSNARILY